MGQWVAVAVGGGIGALARWLLSQYLALWWGPRFPWGTLVVNVLGAALMGACYALVVQRLSWSPEWRAFVTVGLLGGFTTFSTFSLELFTLIEARAWFAFSLYLVLSVAGGLAALVLAFELTRRALG